MIGARESWEIAMGLEAEAKERKELGWVPAMEGRLIRRQ